MSGTPIDDTPAGGRPLTARTPPNRGRVLALLAFGILLVAAAGVASGVVLERRVLSHHGEREHGRLGERRDAGGRHPMHERFGRDLGLTPAQAAKIDSIFASHRPAIDSARAASEPKIRAIIDQTRREIDSVLTPAQREKMHARMMRERPPGDSSEPPGGRRPPP
jgi:Spy/CpxP family protein refolding chaperone